MFSGLIGHRGTIHAVETLSNSGLTLRIACEPGLIGEIEVKDSISINGVCLTATSISGNLVSFDVVPETISRSTLGALRSGDRVNLELSLRVGDRIGGHFVYGHVDAAAQILERRPEGQGERVSIECPDALRRFICEKAFISVDGVSLTVASVSPGRFEIALIPETLQRTTLGERKTGDRVNLEVDPLARYACAAMDERPDEHTQAELEWAFEI